MKKIIFIILSFVFIASLLIVPSFAIREATYHNIDNLIYPSSFAGIRLYNNPNDRDEIGTGYGTLVNLKKNTTYTFIATQGSERLYIGPVARSQQVTGGEFIYDIYSENSINYMSLPNNSQTINGLTFTMDKNTGSITINGTSNGGSTVYYLTGYYVPAGTYYYKVFGDMSLNGSWFYSGFTNEQTGVSGGDYGSGSRFTSNGNNYTFAIAVNGTRTFNNVKIYPGIYKEMPQSFSLGYSRVSYNDNFTTYYTFTTDYISNTYVIGTMDPDSHYASSELFSILGVRDNPNNKYYLLEGEYSYDQILAIANENIVTESYDSGYNSGYTNGYRAGETDGLTATSFMRNTIFSIFSAPFIIVSNVLNFDLFGINVYGLILITITILLIAWIVTRLKGRE